MSEITAIAPEDILFSAISVGEKLLINGAEITRVEDTIRRICVAMGSERTDVFTITTSIVVTMCYQGQTYTQTRRIQKTEYNLHRLELLNQLSRTICARAKRGDRMTRDEIMGEIEKIRNQKGYHFLWMIFFFALSSSMFTLFFGGDLWDAAASAVIGALLRLVKVFLARYDTNPFLASFICSIFGGVMAFLSVKIGFGNSAEMISIGNIMLLAPGITMTNGLRDMFSGNMISGLLRFVEAMLLAIVIALAFVWTSAL